MEKNTETNRTDIEYFSIYDRPRKGRAKGSSKYSDEEKLLRRRQANMKHYYNNHEYYKLYSRLHKAGIRESKKIQINLYVFLLVSDF